MRLLLLLLVFCLASSPVYADCFLERGPRSVEGTVMACEAPERRVRKQLEGYRDAYHEKKKRLGYWPRPMGDIRRGLSRVRKREEVLLTLQPSRFIQWPLASDTASGDSPEWRDFSDHSPVEYVLWNLQAGCSSLANGSTRDRRRMYLWPSSWTAGLQRGKSVQPCRGEVGC